MPDFDATELLDRVAFAIFDAWRTFEVIDDQSPIPDRHFKVAITRFRAMATAAIKVMTLDQNTTTDPEAWDRARLVAEVAFAASSMGRLRREEREVAFALEISRAWDEIKRLRDIIERILIADERGQGIGFAEAMDKAAKEINTDA